MTQPQSPPFLRDWEINEICEPLEQASAQIRYLRSLGMVVNRKPGGRPLVAREEFRRVMVSRNGNAADDGIAAQPNREALLQLFSKGRKSGATA